MFVTRRGEFQAELTRIELHRVRVRIRVAVACLYCSYCSADEPERLSSFWPILNKQQRHLGESSFGREISHPLLWEANTITEVSETLAGALSHWNQRILLRLGEHLSDVR